MPAHTYEGMFLLDSTKAAAAWDDTIKHVHDIKVHPKLEVQLVNQAMTSTPNAEAEEASGHDDELDERPRQRRRDE